MLGALQALTGIVRLESLLEVIKTRVPAQFVDLNKKALDLGGELARAQG
jgi:2-oxoglutarate ferredoxin oxidoreductase subunit gamma